MKVTANWVSLCLSLILAASSRAAEIGFIEDFALATNRESVINQLIPGSEDYYYYQCLNFQNLGQYDMAKETLAAWIDRYGHTSRVEEIRNRQALLNYEKNPKGTLDFLTTQLGLTFVHQREIMGQKPTHPTRLDPRLIDRETFKAAAFANRSDLSEFKDSALEFLVTEKLNGDLRRDLLRRLQRPDYANLVQLVNDDLQYPHSEGFGSLDIHKQMLLAQLDELLKLRPGLLNEVNFVNAYVSKLEPGPDEDWRHDPKARAAYLDALGSFVRRLAPAHNSLKAHALYQRLAHDRNLGVYDKDRFMEYLKLPRNVFYINPQYLEEPGNRDYRASLQANFRSVTLLPPIENDEPLVRDCLMHFFEKEDSFDSYAPYLLDAYLKAVFAETKILNGLGDMEKWYSLLNDPGKYQEIKDRIEIEFPPTGKTFFRPEEPVVLTVDVKNVKTLIVKVFEINTGNYYRERMTEIDSAIDLDGLVAGDEKTYTYDDAPMRRVRRHFEFPSLNRRGVFVIDFIGNGRSSRALIHKGQLTYIERLSSAGHVFTVLDEGNKRLNRATIWISGHEYRADRDGTITVPYSTSPGRQNILLGSDGFTTLDRFDQKAEAYNLQAGFYVDRESLLKRAKARVIVRPTLTVNRVPAALALLEYSTLLIESTDLKGVSTSKEVKGLKLAANEDWIHEFQVPEGVVAIKFTLKGQVQSLSENKKVDLAASRTFALNQIDTTDKVEDLHLSRVPSGYVLQVLGKTGEPRADRPVTLSLEHRDFKRPADAVVQTDAGGRIDLGKMQDIVAVTATGPEGAFHSWPLPQQDRHTYSEDVHAQVGEKIAIPYMGAARAATPALFSLLEKRPATFVRDCLEFIAIAGGFLEISGLPAGTYDLLMKESGQHVTINVAPGEARDGYVLGANRLLEIRNPAPLQITDIVADEKELKIQLANSTGFTRVHVVATRFRPDYDIFESLMIGPLDPHTVVPSKLDSVYVSGRDIGDEYRYILERKYARKYPGNLLSRPSLLLNPWAVRDTELGVAVARSPVSLRGIYGSRSPGSRGSLLTSYGGAGRAVHSANLDFLPSPSVLLANLKPDKDGVVIVARKDLGEGQDAHIVAINPENTSYRELALPETKLVPKDLRLANGLDPARHFTEQKQITILAAASNLTIKDITTSKIEPYDSIGKAYRLYATLSRDAALTEFAFIPDWPKLKPEEQREKYSKYACHELNFFLFKKDPKFFETVILPSLKNKKDKTFMDRWLIGDDLKACLKPWAYGQLNIVERILLAQRIKEEAAATARHLKDLQDLVPPDLDRLNRLFLTAIQGSALETGGYALNLAQAGEKVTVLRRAARAKAAPADAALPGEPEMAATPMNELPAPTEETIAEEAVIAVASERMESLASKDQEAERTLGEDSRKRGEVRQFFRKVEKTQEWAEDNYYHLPIESQNAELVTVNPFWTDYANHAGDGPFLSTHLAEASRNFTEIMLALAVLDLPFDPKDSTTDYRGAQMTLIAKSPMIVFHQEIKENGAERDRTPLLVSQNFFRASDRYRYENGERFDRYVTDEFLTHVVYGCQVVLTDPTSSPLKLDILMQIPRGAVPVNSGFYTESRPVRMEPYSTTSLLYYFYFPAPGSFAHYPLHVARNGQLIAAAQPVTLTAVDTPTKTDTASWDYVSQNGKPEEVLAFLDADSPNRLNLERIAWRMRDKDFFLKATELLSRRHVYQQTLWSYGIYNDLPEAIREYLQHNDGFLAQCGSYLDCKLVTIDPIVRKSYQHLEYSPLVNARAHPLGKRRQILNARLFQQYHALLQVLSCKPDMDDADLLSVVYYLLLQDRVDEAWRFFDRVNPKQTVMQIQYDYLRAYLDFFTPDPKVARAIAAKYRDYPVGRWRNVFLDIVSQLDEAAGRSAAVVDPESRGQQLTRLAATEGSFEFTVESRKVTVNYQNLTEARVNYYLMDVELLFSLNPFVQQRAGQFAFVQPNRSDDLALAPDGKTLAFDLPPEFQNANVMVEIVAGGARQSHPYFANSLAVQVIENYGQVKITHAKTDAPLAKVYVKVYARMKDDAIQFYKDGYTDLRGRFDYASLSTSELDNVAEFALLILSEADGAVTRTAKPPKQ